MLEPLIAAILILILKAIADTFLPGVPVSDELINAIVIGLIGWLGLGGVKAVLPSYTKSKLMQKGLLKE